MASIYGGLIAAMMAATRARELAREEKERNRKLSYSQWSKSPDGASCVPVGNTFPTLDPGYYDIGVNDGQIFFVKMRPRTDDLLKFPDSVSKNVLDGITDFWAKEERFKKYGMPYKRGILMHGPPGSGKSCTLQLIARDVVNDGGVVITYNPSCFLIAYRALRDIQPDVRVVVLMEDFESLMKNYESKMLNLLDGVESLDKVVFLATTNYPEMLQARVVNRPSRFDLVVRVPHPSVESRILYVNSLLTETEKDDIDAKKYAEDTKGMSLAHLKELFVATMILGCGYEESLQRLKDMCNNKLSSLDNDEGDLTGGMFL